MMRKTALFLAGTLLAAISCSVHEWDSPESAGSAGKIELSGNIDQVYETRASDTGFADGDRIGVYVVDWNGTSAPELAAQGNRADNLRFTFDESSWKWIPDHDLYWKDKTTHIDVYGYYPYAESPEDVTKMPFEVQKDQSRGGGDGILGGYEQSDFLWGAALDNAPTQRTINLKFRHRMAGARVTLTEGTGFDSAEWASAEKSVILQSAVRTSLIDLRTGEVTVTGEKPATGTIAARSGNDWRCIVVPQTIAAGDALVTVTVGGIAYSLRKGEAFTFVPGKQHNFTITVNKRADTGTYEFVVTSESIVAWENDSVSHDAAAREYIVVDVPKAGTLDDCIIAAGKNLKKVRNLKLTGQINSRDFAVMRFLMDELRALNMKEVRIVAGAGGSLGEGRDYSDNKDDEIPNSAMSGKESLVSLVLPDRLKSICGESGGGVGRGAFSYCSNLSGSLIIPEGVEVIGHAAFHDCKSLTGTLSLPSTLRQIGSVNGYDPVWDGAFRGCGFVCELKLPEGLEEIGMGTFSDCRGLYGELRLPQNLKKLGASAFSGCMNLEGSLVIPQGVTDIPSGCFDGTWLGGTLTLHNGIGTIGASAFANTGFKGELRLPENLETVGSHTFYNCDFSGELVLPKKLRTIGDRAFAYNWRLMGVLEIPQDVMSIGAGAFAHCRSLEGVIFPEGLESLRFEPEWGEDGGSFQGCYGIGRIVCKGTIPAHIQSGAFDGVAKDNFTLEVPESAIAQYQAADGWKDFKRIAAYRNFVIRPQVATAINTSVTRDLVLTADEPWTVESQPEWVELDRTSGDGKCELKLTFAQMPHGAAENREGEVVFKMRDKDYRTRVKVTQWESDKEEDEVVTLQKATRGKGVNIVILCDGYNAKDIHDGKLLADATQTMEYYFGVEPYKTYRDYFNVYTAVSVSPESGVGSVNTIVYNKFNTTAKGGVTLGGRNSDGSDYEYIMDYACKAPTVSRDNLGETLVIMVPNTADYGGICYWWPDGFSIAYCPKSDYGYPLDWRGVIQHEAGGHGFGKLGDEYIYHNTFIDACDCTCCAHFFSHDGDYNMNISMTGKMSEVPWSHLIFHEKYRGFVDIFEGGFMHNRGVFRSEQNSCMNNDIPYYSTISREYMVRRIMKIAGEEFSFEKFVERDVTDAGTADTRASWERLTPYAPMGLKHAMPVMMGTGTETHIHNHN